MSALPIIEPAPSDAELIARARAGSDDAFTELYERHAASAQAAARALTRSKTTAEDLVAEGFTRLLSALRNGAGPEVAFRPYLLACVRNAYYDRTRKDSRVEWSQDIEEAVPGDSLALLDPNMEPEERHLIARAFTTLPERWQLVLWHTEVEGRQPADVAPLLGLAPNAVAALAYRAREGLRKAYLQAHLQAQPPDECRFTRERLGAYVRDGVNPREREQIEEHLDRCDDCKAMYLELVDVDSTLRRALIPLIIGVTPAAYLKFVGGGGIVKWVSRSSRAQAAVAAVTVAAVVSGAVLLSTATDRDQNVASVAPSAVGRTTTTRADLGTIAPPTRRPSTSTGSIPRLTVPPTVSTVNRPSTPGRGSSSIAPPPGPTVVPTVTTPPRNTTTTRRPATTSTTRKPATTTTRPATTTSPSTIDPDEPVDRPTSTTAAGGGGSPIVTPAPPTTPALTSTGSAAFEAPDQLFAGDLVLVELPVRNNGASGSPNVTLTLANASPPPVPPGGPGNAPRIFRQGSPGTCAHVGGGRYSCQHIDAGATSTLRVPIVLGGRGLTVSVSSDVVGSSPLTSVIRDPVTSTATFTPDALGAVGTLVINITNNANGAPVSDINPTGIKAPWITAASGNDAETRAACGAALPQVSPGEFHCTGIAPIPAKGTTTLTLLLTGPLPSGPLGIEIFVGYRDLTPVVVNPPPPLPDAGATTRQYSGDGNMQVEVRSAAVSPQRPPEATVVYAALLWTGQTDLLVAGTGETCTPQELDGVAFHYCDITRRTYDHYVATIEPKDPSVVVDWRMLMVVSHPGAPSRSVEIFSRLEKSPNDLNHFTLSGQYRGLPELGVIGFRGGVGGSATLSEGGGKMCIYVNPYDAAFTARVPYAAHPGCPLLGANLRFTFSGPPAVVPEMFIVQRPA